MEWPAHLPLVGGGGVSRNHIIIPIKHKRNSNPKTLFSNRRVIIKRITSQCQPPRSMAFLTTPWRPTSTDLVRLLLVTTTLLCREERRALLRYYHHNSATEKICHLWNSPLPQAFPMQVSDLSELEKLVQNSGFRAQNGI